MSFAVVGIAAGVTAATGAYTAISAGKQQKKAQKNLDDLARNSPLYKSDKTIDDYYQKALSRFTENPFQSLQYQVGAKEARRATAQGLNAFQGRKVLGDISTLAEREKSYLQQLGAQAEGQSSARFNQLGNATQMKSGEYQREFDFNKMTPYNRKLQLEQMKAAAAGERLNAGLQMIGQSAQVVGSAAASNQGE